MYQYQELTPIPDNEEHRALEDEPGMVRRTRKTVEKPFGAVALQQILKGQLGIAGELQQPCLNRRGDVSSLLLHSITPSR
jgi:hypothetical protein